MWLNYRIIRWKLSRRTKQILIKEINLQNKKFLYFTCVFIKCKNVNIKSVDTNTIKVDEKSCKNILIYYIGYVTFKDSEYIKVYSVNPLYLIFNKVNRYFEETNKNKYLSLVPATETKEKIKR